jgi:hypothetical protein
MTFLDLLSFFKWRMNPLKEPYLVLIILGESTLNELAVDESDVGSEVVCVTLNAFNVTDVGGLDIVKDES